MIDHDARQLVLAGAVNVRDLGGLPVIGGRVAPGRLFRGMFTPRLTDADLRILTEEIGLRLVVDLRSDAEVRDAPGALRIPELGWAHFPLPVADGVLPHDEDDYRDLYCGFLEHDPAPLRGALVALMEAADHPALFHCAAGKDRTGIVSAMLLEVLGVPRAVITQDYVLTDRHLPALTRRLNATEIYRLAPGSPGHQTFPQALEAVLDVVHERYGGSASWLLEQGVPEELVSTFRNATTVAAP